jgi:hypothetical protein
MSKKINTSTAPDLISTEAELVQRFVLALEAGKTCWGAVEVMTEWCHPTGAADILVRTNQGGIIAFEAKLTEWRRAYHQAYRNTMYANRVYVLMPSATVHRPLPFKEEFRLRGIGLCSYNAGKIHVHIGASEQDELLTWVRRKAHENFDGALNEPRDSCRLRSPLLQK